MSRSLLLHDAMPEPASRPSLAITAKGFRPFFLLAAAFAVAIVPLWLFVLYGQVAPIRYLDPMNWHAHEMVFGFVSAVIAGFLLTAVGNWTKRETAVGVPLMLLAALWLLGRLAMAFAGSLPRGVPAIVDLAFLPALLVALGRPLVATGNRRNFVMLAVIGALFTANVIMHLDALGIAAVGDARRASLVSVDLVLVVISIMAGRVFPMFTRNATGLTSIRSIPSLDALTIGGMAVLAVLDALAVEGRAAAAFSGIVGVITVLRAMHWGAQHSLRQPLLWILHAGYAWLALGLVLRAIAGFESAVPASLATHALTVGVIGSLTLGMMARVALGHTGRALVAPRPMAWAFAAINVAAVLRAIVPISAPGWYRPTLVAAGTFWTVAFLVFLIVYTPILTRARTDGRPG